MKDMYVVVTMDCERPTSETHPSASGPPDYGKAEAWTRTYAELADEYGFPVTFFIHPEVALAHNSQIHALTIHKSREIQMTHLLHRKTI